MHPSKYSSKVSFSLLALLTATALICGCGQRFSTIQPVSSSRIVSSRGVVDDWSTHHVRFSSPGTEADAIRNGTHDKWLRIMSDPRFQMQQLQRSPAWQERSRHIRYPLPSRHPGNTTQPGLKRDWASRVDGGDFGGIGGFPAKYTFNTNAAPSCSDYVAFTVLSDGSATQANIVGLNNLYDGTCPSSAGTGQPFAPSVMFAYFVDTGIIWTSPVLSEDGTKIAFVAYNSQGITFHVITLGATGNNGTAYNAPVTPCTINGTTSCYTNNAVDTSFSISTSTSTTSPLATPFVDYSGDIAYVGDETGNLHKIAGVFRGSPAEVKTGGWPFTVQANAALSGPVYDSVSRHIFLTASTGTLFCIDVSSGVPAYCANQLLPIAFNGGVYDGPTVDSAAGTVFAEGTFGNGTGSPAYTPSLTQTTTSLSSSVEATMGSGNAILFSGDFDNSYYSGNYSSGYMYFCGGSPSGAYYNPSLYRIGFDSNGIMKSANDGNGATLASSGSCTPLTEAYNPGQGKDYLFLGLDDAGTRTGCNAQACVMSFELGSSFPFVPAATLPLNNTAGGLSSIVIDNVSSASGASQIYFFNGTNGSATQASQNGLN